MATLIITDYSSCFLLLSFSLSPLVLTQQHNHFSVFNIKKWLVSCHSRKSQGRNHVYGQLKSTSKIKTNSIKSGFGLHHLGAP